MADFNERFSSASSGEQAIRPENASFMYRTLMHSSFPKQGDVHPVHEGSQSVSPNKEDNYTDTNTNVPPIDRGAYGPGY